MHGSSDSRRYDLELRAVFSPGELASFARVPRHQLRRLLEQNRVKLVRSGRARFVPLSAVEERIPALSKNVRAVEEVCVTAIEKARAAEEGDLR